MRALVVLVVLAGCTPIARTFRCAASSQCVHDGVAGTCEPTGWCSFPDASCPSGRRYGGFVGDGDADQCVTPLAAGGACVAQLAVGNGFGCALGHDGSVACWGKNDHGQLGNGGTSDAAGAVAVLDDHGAPIANVAALATGDAHVCATRQDRTVVCWGDGSAGQLGTGGTAAVNPVPAPVPLTDVVALAAGAQHTCAALGTGAVWCWGANDAGQLGSAPSAGSAMPVEVVQSGQAIRAVALAGGATHSCATTATDLVCWGSDVDGELGDTSTATTRLPTTAALATAPTAIAAGAHVSCALVGAGVRCFGRNDVGQAGQPPGGDVLVPTAVAVDGATAIGAAGTHACALATTGALSCWGDGGGVAVARDGVAAFAVGADDVCSVLGDGVACAAFGDAHVACR